MEYLLSKNFHAYLDTEVVRYRPSREVVTTEIKHFLIQEREVHYRFYLHQHPYVQKLIQRLIQKSVGGLQAADTDYRKDANGLTQKLPDGKNKPVLYGDIFTTTRYNPSSLVQQPFPVKDLDFSYGGAYAVYNWELFFHVPFVIATHLSKNGRYAEAQQWFHYIFDPTDDSDEPAPGRFWKLRPFQYTDVQRIEEILINLSTGADAQLRDDTVRSIEAWKDAPFRPHVVARYRQQAYMIKTVMAYLDNLIAWGDSLFRQDTGESINEAMILYVMAANICGPRPQALPSKGQVRPQTYANLRKDLDKFGNALRNLETELIFEQMPHPSEAGDNERLAVVRGIGKALYFCVPRNEKLLAYWDTIADRLFKIRNSLNFQGIFRQLPLFEPPIDPALLARAAASGLDVGAVVNGLNQPLPLVRFQILAQKAAEVCQEVKSLGANLLSAMEKEDGEAMAILRARHERAVLEMAEHIKYGQLQEAVKSKEGLFQSLENAVQRYTYYERQLGKKPEDIKKAIPALGEVDREILEQMRIKMVEGQVNLRNIDIDIAADLDNSEGKIISSFEEEELSKSGTARDIQDIIKFGKLAAQGIRMLPDFGIKFHFWGLGGDMKIGGSTLGAVASYGAEVAMAIGDRLSYEAGLASKVGSYARREQDWAFQSNLAAGEINQIMKQLRGAQLREAIAERELKNHRTQMEHAAEIERFLNAEGTEKEGAGKKTNKAFYTWMKREVKGLYSQSFQFAFDIARKAERALQHELGNPELRFLQYGYTAGKEGLLAGEKLYFDLKRMDMAYMELNRREYELTKHVSVLQTDPMALLQLRTTGRCTLRLPEDLFDMDGPGHYFRRIKTVAVSIPCVAGPYISVNCTLTLLKSSIRKTPVVGDDGYARNDGDDARFDDYFGSMQSIVTSTAQNDSGMFETNLRDERYLPFEGAGVISEWQLELPANPGKGDPQQFDYNTISDVILHLRYTARAGGGLLRNGATGHLKSRIENAEAMGSVRLFSLRYEFPTEWAKFQHQAPEAGNRFELAFLLRPEHYPFWSQGRLGSVQRLDILARSAKTPAPASIDIFDKAAQNEAGAKKDTLAKDAALGNLLIGKLSGGANGIALPAKPDGAIKWYFEDRDLTDLWLLVKWGGD